jgi:hypothetical protein
MPNIAGKVILGWDIAVIPRVVESSWNVMAHGDAMGGGGEGETGEWSA